MATTAVQPIEARCDHCKQARPLFLYQPDHGHLGSGMFTCRWCTRDTQPLLCVRCWGIEKQREEDDPGINQEADTLEQICATNRRIEERKAWRAAADAAMCEGIADATRIHTDSGTP